jgi:DNA-binding response OmpR family regulator
MPDLDGYEVCRQLRADPATAAVPIVIVTAHSSLIDQPLGLEAGADRFLIKPVSISILTGLADTLITAYRNARAAQE